MMICEEEKPCKKTMMESDLFMFGLEMDQVRYFDEGCGETEERCEVKLNNLKGIFEDFRVVMTKCVEWND